MEQFRILTITHKKLNLTDLGQFVLPEEVMQERLLQLMEQLSIGELFYLQTCNRVTYVFTADTPLQDDFINRMFTAAYPELEPSLQQQLPDIVDRYSGLAAIRHFLSVASSVDSLVIGEREIHKQIRLAYEKCRQMGLTGDFLRLLVKHAIEVAKRVFTETDISKKPVSVVSLATKALREHKVPANASIAMIGAGNTNTLMVKLLAKYGYRVNVIFNRTLKKAEILAQRCDAQALPLASLAEKMPAFDVIITCTGATAPIIDSTLYHQLPGTREGKKVIIDLAVPRDVSDDVAGEPNVEYVDVEQLRTLADQNKNFRRQALGQVMELIEEEVYAFEKRLHQRQIERAFRGVSSDVKELRSRAVEAVFAEEVASLDPEAKATMEKVLDYMEKKFISIPYTRARQAFS